MCRQNATKGRQAEPPLSYQDVMDLAKGVLCRAGHSGLVNMYSIDPYANRNGGDENELKRLREKVCLDILT